MSRTPCIRTHILQDVIQLVLVVASLFASCIAYSQPNVNQPPVDNATNSPQYAHLILSYPSASETGHDTGLVIIPLIANGSLHRNFLVDTGSTFSAITDDTAKELGLTPKTTLNEVGKPIIIDGKPAVSVEVANLKTSDGKFDLHGTFIVTSRSPLAALPEFKRVDGIIGINILSQMGLLCDFANHSLTLILPGKLSQEEVQALGFTAPAIALTRATINQLFYAPLAVTSGAATEQEQALIDTGSTLTLISAKLAGKIKLRSVGSTGLAGGILGTRTIFTSSVDTLHLGNQSLVNPTVHYPKSDLTWPPPQLGVDVLSHFRVLFDFSQRKMYLAPATPLVPAVQVKPMTAVPSAKP